MQKNVNKNKHKIKYNIGNLKKLCENNWPKLIASIAPELNEAISKRPKHCKCVVHGGVDGNGLRAYDDFDETGGMVCNTCGYFSDGFSTLMWVKGYEFITTVEKVVNYLKEYKLIKKSELSSITTVYKNHNVKKKR